MQDLFAVLGIVHTMFDCLSEISGWKMCAEGRKMVLG